MTLSPSHFVPGDCSLGFCHGRVSQSILNAPPAAEPVAQKSLLPTKAAIPLGACEAFSVERNQHVVASVAMLLDVSRPPAIPRFVVPVVVWESVYRVFGGWTRPHVSEKVLKRSPSFAYGYAACSVVFVARGILVRAPRPHAGPDSVLGGRMSANAMTVLWGLFLDLSACSLCASTRNPAPTGEVYGLRKRIVSAITNAPPNHTATDSLFGRFCGYKSAKSLAGKVNGFFHGFVWKVFDVVNFDT